MRPRSSDEQESHPKRDALAALGVAPERIYVAHGVTGTNQHRPGSSAVAAQIVPAIRRPARPNAGHVCRRRTNPAVPRKHPSASAARPESAFGAGRGRAVERGRAEVGPRQICRDALRDRAEVPAQIGATDPALPVRAAGVKALLVLSVPAAGVGQGGAPAAKRGRTTLTTRGPVHAGLWAEGVMVRGRPALPGCSTNSSSATTSLTM